MNSIGNNGAFIDILMSQHNGYDPNNTFLSEEQQKDKQRAIYEERLEMNGLKDKIKLAVDTIYTEQFPGITPKETEDLLDELKQKRAEFLQIDSPEKLLSRDKTFNNFSLLFGMGKTLYRAKQFQKAEAIFTLLRVLDLSNPRVWFLLGAAEKNLGKYREAIISFEIVIGMVKDDALSYLLTSECYLSLNNQVQAEHYFRLGSDINSTSPNPLPQKVLDTLKQKIGLQ